MHCNKTCFFKFEKKLQLCILCIIGMNTPLILNIAMILSFYDIVEADMITRRLFSLTVSLGDDWGGDIWSYQLLAYR